MIKNFQITERAKLIDGRMVIRTRYERETTEERAPAQTEEETDND